jgi:hypothetical protein
LVRIQTPSFELFLLVINCLTISGRIRDFHQFWWGTHFTIIMVIVDYFGTISIQMISFEKDAHDPSLFNIDTCRDRVKRTARRSADLRNLVQRLPDLR